MRKITALLAGVLAGAAGLAGGRAMAEREDAKPAAPGCAAAYISLQKVFLAYPRARKIQEGLQAEADGLKSSLLKQRQDLKKEAQDFEARLSPGTPEYEQARRKIELAMAAIDWDEKAGLANLNRQQVTEMASVYKEVCTEAERIASERGFACVLNYDSEDIRVEDRGQVMGNTELRLQMALRTVVWARPEADITKDVIDALMPK